MNGYPATDRVLSGGVAVPASQTKQPVSKETGVTASGSLHMVVAADVTAVAGPVNLILQTAVESSWVDVKTVAVSATGVSYIRLLAEAAADQAVLPLLNKVRLVATTGVGQSITVSKVWFLQNH